MIHPIRQILRFYIINKTVSYRTIESLVQSPNYNPLLKKCVQDVKRFPDWAISECNKIKGQISNREFKFDSGNWAMDIRDEDLPKGIEIDWVDLRQVVVNLRDWVISNKDDFAKEFGQD